MSSGAFVVSCAPTARLCLAAAPRSGAFFPGGLLCGAGPKGANTFAWQIGDVVDGFGNSAGLDHITDFGSGDVLDLSGVFLDLDPCSQTTCISRTSPAARWCR